MDYPYRYFLSVAASEQAAANVVAQQVDPGDGSNTYSVPLCPGDIDPVGATPTRYGCSTLTTREQRSQMLAALSGLDTVRFVRLDAETRAMLGATEAVADGCSFDDYLAAMGCQRVRTAS